MTTVKVTYTQDELLTIIRQHYGRPFDPDLISAGDAQERMAVLRSNAVSASNTILTSDNATPSASNIFIIPNNAAVVFSGTVVARDTSGNIAAWTFSGAVKRAVGVSTIAFVGVPTFTMVGGDTAPMLNWGATAVVNTTLGGFSIQVNMAAGVTGSAIARVVAVEHSV